MRIATIIAIALLLSGCENYDDGDTVRAYVTKDPANPCRILLRVIARRGDVRHMAAQIEGCQR